MRTAPLAALLLLAACAEPPREEAKPAPVPEPRVVLEPVEFAALPGWSDDPLGQALPALHASCDLLTKPPAERALGLAGEAGDWQAPCAALAGLASDDHEAVRAALERWFVPFAVTDRGEPEGLFTGYYEAELRGARRPNGSQATPLYRRPSDLVTADLGAFRDELAGERLVGRVRAGRFLPYLTRAEIEAGALAGRGLELLWADDPVDAFFLHVQGSGRVLLPDGEVVRVGYAASNGHPFYAIGRALIDEGAIPRDQMSMQGIRDWLRRHPARAREVMQRNDRFIFFREIEGPGPIGAQGVPLTAGRSLAVDPDHLPLGVPLWLDTTWPARERPLRRLMVAQDSGAAITGPVRGDFFWGSGEAALAEAGRMRQSGRYFVLLPRALAERRKATS